MVTSGGIGIADISANIATIKSLSIYLSIYLSILNQRKPLLIYGCGQHRDFFNLSRRKECTVSPAVGSRLKRPGEASICLLISPFIKTMAEHQAYIKSGYYGYPPAKEGPKTPFSNTPGANPVLRGLPLAVAGSACVNRFPE